MLILTRQIGESIIIDNDIVIKLLDVGRSNAKIGIEANKETSIYREEIYLKIHYELIKNGKN